MATPATLFGLFGDFRAAWPAERLRHTRATDAEVSAWLDDVNDAITLRDVRTSADGDRVAVEARYWIDLASVGAIDGLPLVMSPFPDVEFRVQALPSQRAGWLFVSMSDAGADVLVEGLPVEIRLPRGMVSLHPDDEGPAPPFEKSRGAFSAGTLDHQRVVYRRDEPTSIFTHVRLRVTPDLEIELTTPVVIGFGKCRFLEVPVLAVHDFRLLPSPRAARETEEWLRHGIEPWITSFEGSLLEGCFAFRGLHLDPAYPPVSDIVEAASGHAERREVAQLVLDDVVLPFLSEFIVPIPRHITVGIRRNLLTPYDEQAVFDFEEAPVQLSFGGDPKWGIVIESFFYRSRRPAPPDEPVDPGITFSAAVFFGEINEPNHAITIGLGENLTPRIGYRRELNADGPGLVEDGTEFNLLKFRLLGTAIEIMGLTIGYSIGRAVGEDADFGDCFELYGDLFVSSEPTGGEDSFFKLRSLQGEALQFAVEGLGWKQGAFSLEGARAPDGVVMLFGPVGFIFQELGIVAESGATYFMFSGGLLIEPPGGTSGGVSVKRLRFRIAGSPDAPFFKLDGIFAFFKSDTVYIEAGGYFTDETVAAVRRKEFAFTGTVIFEAGGAKYGLSIDLISGDIQGPDEQFEYFMLQLVLRVMIPVYTFAITGIRLLVADEMLPRLSAADLSAVQMRYYSWYRSSDPLTVPGDRRLAAWRPQRKAWAFGIGMTVTIVGCDSVFQITGFVMVLDSPDEAGLLVALELFIAGSKRPNGWVIVEVDFKNDRFAVQIGVELRISDFFGDDAPEWINVVTLKGTVLFGNKPTTIAVGRIRDQRTWLSLVADIDLWVSRAYVLFALCFEYVDGGDLGIGFVTRLEGAVTMGVARISYNAGFGVVFASFQTGSVDSSFLIFIEAGIRADLFGFLRFGISAGLHYKAVAYDPARKEFVAELTFETPWFLPDVTIRLEWTSGAVMPAELATFTSPLEAVSGYQEVTGSIGGSGGGATFRVHEELWDPRQLDPATGAELPRATHSLAEFRARTIAEGPRVDRFLQDTSVAPIPTDAGIAIAFTARVDDGLGLGPVPPGQGQQTSGDLEIRYELVGLRVRRRPRFQPGAAWTLVEERQALAIDFDAPGGPALTGSFGPHELTKFWNEDLRTAGGTATKKLLINASTPYDLVTSNPEADEATVAQNPHWPCCPPRTDRGLRQQTHRLDFRGETPGIGLEGDRRFSDSESRLRPVAPAVIAPHTLAGLAVGILVASVPVPRPSVLLEADLDEPGIYCSVTLAAWAMGVAGEIALVALDGVDEVGRTAIPLPNGAMDFRRLGLTGSRPFRRFEVRVARPLPAPPPAGPGVGPGTPSGQPDAPLGVLLPEGVYVEVDELTYYTAEELTEEIRDAVRCDTSAEDFLRNWEARGKLFFLPNQQYEVETTVRLSSGHPSVETEHTEVREYAYFQTKGLPGLNAQPRVGQEVERYVRSVYSGGRSLVYREEPVAVAFHEDFHIAVPIALRPPGAIAERHQLFRMALTVTPAVATDTGTVFTTPADDWIVAHRIVPAMPEASVWVAVLGDSTEATAHAESASASRERLARVTQRADAHCPLADPTDAISPLLLARPQGTPDPEVAGAELWRAATSFTAVVRQRSAPFVGRAAFEAADLTALDFQSDPPGGGADAWSVADGELRVANPALQFACFGEDTWNHIRIRATVRPGSSIGGLALSLPVGAPARGLFVWIQQGVAGRELAVHRRRSGTELVSLEVRPLAGDDEWIGITVTAFDDRLRVESGDVAIEIDREELREGRLALIGQGDVRFRSIAVEGLDIYAFPFTTSRYRDFAQHIASFDGRLATIAPDMLGAGSTTQTVGALWLATRDQVSAVMRPGVPAVERQVVFGQWSAGLGLPLVQAPDRLLISRLTSGGPTAAFLLESPEPIDFTEEVTATLEQRARERGGDTELIDAALDPLLENLIALITERRGPGLGGPIPPRPGPPRGGAMRGRPLVSRGAHLAELMRLDRLAARIDPRPAVAGNVGASRATAVPRMAPSGAGLLDLDMQGGRLHARIDGPRPARAHGAVAGGFVPQRLHRGDRVVFAEILDGAQGDALRVRRWSGNAKRSGAAFHVDAQEEGESVLRGAHVATLTADDLARLTGLVIAIDPSRGVIIDWTSPRWRWDAVSVRVLQDDTARRALLVPVNGANVARGLSANRFRLQFAMDRARWATTDPPDADNRYRRTATLTLNV